MNQVSAITNLSVFELKDKPEPVDVDFASYDNIVVFFSGGKDSIAAALELLDQGIPASKIELHHHRIDGAPGSEHFMDWPVTSSYCELFAKAFGFHYKESWREGGFKAEMLRENALTNAMKFVSSEDQLIAVGGVRGKLNTRRRFPQVSASLSTRWCSSSLKIDVGSGYLNNDPKFINKRTLVITGERAEESANRANYSQFEPHRSDLRNGKKYSRHIDHYRPVHQWSEKEIWSILEKHGVVAHPAYFLGFGRCSCLTCIFGNKDQWATIKQIASERFETIADFETEFNCTIHRTLSVKDQAEAGNPYKYDEAMAKVGMSETYSLPIKVSSKDWVLPSGAFGDSCGPT